jgi:eukaryotic-like serine/threonine-protein kinase
MKLSRELWLQVEPLLLAALDMEAGARREWLRRVDASHPEAAPVLRKMIDSHERAERSRELETVPRLASAPAWSSVHAPGERIGPFELVRPIGHGGMGEVWLARQADGRMQREVALKLPALHQQGEGWRERFRRERDILASLEHPHIARLYDAGLTQKGQPWLAMEYVAGLSLSEHVASRPYSIAARLALFRQVLAAVAHAHRHLVVHRDLKPANILVDASGQVKLLDFGIAKLVDAAAAESPGDLTRLGGRVMTLRYAAPEQVAAGAITTATDIYSLGVILHELVTGLAPYRAVREGRALTDAMFAQEETAVPSRLALDAEAARERALAGPRQLARAIAGDLDAIVLKAMRRAPGDRYASVELFDADILAHLERRPVKARAGTWRYLAGRFAVRHKLPLATAAAVLLTLLAGLVVADRERRVAVAEKARAERHFAGVRKLANAFMFDVHGEIEPLAGSLKARRLLVSTSLEYLDSLAQESSADAELGLEVATAYRKIAAILGDTLASNLGEPAAARRHAEKALALLDGLDARRPGDIAVLRERRAAQLLLARMLKDSGDPATMRVSADAQATAERIIGLPAASYDDRRQYAYALGEHALNLAVVGDDQAGALRAILRVTGFLEALCAERPTDFLARAGLGSAYERASIITELSMRAQDTAPAVALLRKSIAVTEALARDDPLNQAHEQALVKRYSNIAGTEQANGESDAAAASSARAVEIAERLVAREPGNAGNAVSQLRALAVASGIERDRGANDRAIARGQQALALFATLPGEVRRGLRTRAQVAVAQSHMGMARLAQAGDASLPKARRVALAREARAWLGESRAFREEIIALKLDVTAARVIVGQLDEQIAKCDELISRLARA